MTQKFDMAIIGGGPGGYVAALRARQLGLTVALAERERVGGVCLNRGCIPTKTLLSHVDGLLWLRRSVQEGILDGEPAVNFSAMIRRKNEIVENIVSGLEELLLASGVVLYNDDAKISEPGVMVTSAGNSITANNLVIATGAKPWVPPIPGTHLPGVLGTRQILALGNVPQSLVIIGGGVVGQEFAAIFAGLGSRVTVLEALDRILNEVDAEIARRYASVLRSKGITAEDSVQVRAIEKAGDLLRVIYERKSKEKTVDADLVLMATGRRPNTQGCGIEGLGIILQDGAVEVDDFLRTSAPGIYAIGDVIGRQMLAHVASYHGEIVAENVAGLSRPADETAVPACVFTSPQIAWVGLTEEDAKKTGRAFRTSTFSLSASGKAQAVGESRGLIKIIEDAGAGRLVGAHLFGPNVSELIGEATLVVRKGLLASDLAETIHAHPTISEALREAALGLLGGPIHAQTRTRTIEPS